MTKRIVIHRDRTFTYQGRTFRLYGSHGSDPKNWGWGYEIVDVETGEGVADGYMTFHEVRTTGLGDIDAWMDQRGLLP